MAGKTVDFDKAYKQIGKRLRKLRVEAGFTSSFDFAYAIKMTPSQYAAYERGVNMKVDTLLIILAGLKISLSEFFSEGFE